MKDHTTLFKGKREFIECITCNKLIDKKVNYCPYCGEQQ